MGIAWLVDERGDQQRMIALGSGPGRIGVADNALRAIPRDVALQAGVLPLDISAGELTLMTGPDVDLGALQRLDIVRGLKIVRVAAPVREEELKGIIANAYARLIPPT